MIKLDAVGLMTNGTKWFPIVFKESPENPGEKGFPKRMRSMGHHKEGFATKEKAEESIIADGLLSTLPRLKGDLFWGENPNNKIIRVNEDFTMS